MPLLCCILFLSVQYLRELYGGEIPREDAWGDNLHFGELLFAPFVRPGQQQRAGRFYHSPKYAGNVRRVPYFQNAHPPLFNARTFQSAIHAQSRSNSTRSDQHHARTNLPKTVQTDLPRAHLLSGFHTAFGQHRHPHRHVPR